MPLHHPPPSRSLPILILALALSACAANTPQRLCHGPLTPINKTPINTAPINASTPARATK